MKKPVKIAYLVGPIEHSANPDSYWRHVLEELLEPLGIKCINPVKISYLIGRGIKDNAKYAGKLKRTRDRKNFQKFMRKIWGQDKSSVDSSGILVCWVRTPQELKELNASGGTFREFMRGARKKKKLFLICEVSLEKANSHLLDVILSSGVIFENVSQLIACLKHYNKTGGWHYPAQKREVK